MATLTEKGTLMAIRSYLAALLVLIAPSLAGAETTSASDGSLTPDGLADLLISGLEHPIRLRLLVTCDGVAWREHHRTARDRHLQALFDQLDTNGDRRLTGAEATRLPSPQSFGSPDPDSEVYVAFNFRVLDADDNGTATIDELAGYLAGFRDVPLHIATQKNAQVSGDLFSVLDSDRDGRLTAQESLSAPTLFERDRDGNGVLTGDELRRPSESVFGPEFVAVPLSGSAVGRPLTFELERASDAAADVIVRVDFPRQPAFTGPSIDVTLSPQATSWGLRTETEYPDFVVIHLGNRRLQLRVLPAVFRQALHFRQALRREFTAVAERSGGQVTSNADLPPVLRTAFSVSDGNGDGRLEREELEECLDRFVAAQLAATASRLQLTVFAERRGLRALIDRNLDGRLSSREIERLPEQLDRLAGTQGHVSRDSVPTTVALLLQQGPSEDAGGAQMVLNAGPPWFFRADTNQDGDLSPEEFLGTPDIFHRLDANSDGWVDLQEAIRGDQFFPPATEVQQ